MWAHLPSRCLAGAPANAARRRGPPPHPSALRSGAPLPRGAAVGGAKVQAAGGAVQVRAPARCDGRGRRGAVPPAQLGVPNRRELVRSRARRGMQRGRLFPLQIQIRSEKDRERERVRDA